jgi:hypothetical protein
MAAPTTFPSEIGTLKQHAEHINRAQRNGYLHQILHEVSGLTRSIVEAVPRGTGMYLVGEGKVVHRLDACQVRERDIRVVTVDRELPQQPPAGVDAQIHCDLSRLSSMLRQSAQTTLDDRMPFVPGSFVASHIARYLPEEDTSTLLHAGMDALRPGGNIWLVDTPLAARLRKHSNSPGFCEGYDIAQSRDDVRIAVDAVIAPVVPEGLYFKLNDMRARVPGSDDMAFLDAVQDGIVRFASVPAADAEEGEFRIRQGGRIRVNGWGIRAMMLQKA